MSEYNYTCLICGSKERVHPYSDFSCDRCGQDYRYGEGHRIDLDAGQVELLRTAAQLKWCQQLTPEIVDDIDKVAKSMDVKRKLYDGVVEHLTTLHKAAE